jgi:hypothetical protein
VKELLLGAPELALLSELLFANNKAPGRDLYLEVVEMPILHSADIIIVDVMKGSY